MLMTPTAWAALVTCAMSACALGQFLEPEARVIMAVPGSGPGAFFGAISESIGDLSGDGVPEWGTCEPFSDVGGERSGRVVIFHGKTAEVLREHLGEPLQELSGPAPSGDVNNDGVPDYAVFSGPNSSPQFVRVYSGDLSLPIPSALLHEFFEWEPSSDFGGGGWAGDVDGDRHDDFFLTAHSATGFQPRAGAVRIVSGRTGAIIREHLGSQMGDWFGNTARGIGDLDGDFVDDYYIGIPQSSPPATDGKARVYSGRSGALLYELRPNSPSAAVFSLWYAYPLGDVTGDMIPDLMVADTGDFVSGFDTGRIYMYSGATGGLHWSRPGSGGHQGFGIGHRLGFDYSGDGFEELLVGSYLASQGAPDAGKAQLISGATGDILRTITSTTANEAFGSDTHGCGDIDGDFIPDMVVTAWSNDQGGADAGMMYIIAGIDHRPPCYADCHRTGWARVLDVFDFLCFQDAFVSGDPYADCDGSGLLDIIDFLCFQDEFLHGCS